MAWDCENLRGLLRVTVACRLNWQAGCPPTNWPGQGRGTVLTYRRVLPMAESGENAERDSSRVRAARV